MALHTITLDEYLNAGGKLPPAFNNIPSILTDIYNPENPEAIIPTEYTFSEMFVDRYCAREIGFETPALFYKRLNGVAVLKVEEYVRKIKAYNDTEDVFEVEHVDIIQRTGHNGGGATTENFVGSFNGSETTLSLGS